MKKLLVTILVVAFMASPSFAANGGGGKKKAKKKARIECKKDKNCDLKCCDMPSCPKEEKCTPTSTCAGMKE